MYKQANSLVKRYFEDPDVNITEEIAKVASQENWSPHQIQYVANKVNKGIVSKIQSGVPKGEYDPHFTIDPIKTASIIALIKNKPSKASPSLPPDVEVEGPSCEPLDVPEDRSQETFQQYLAAGEAPSDMKMQMLSHLRDKVKKKKAKIIALENKLNDLIASLTTKVAHQVLSGTPLEVIDALELPDVCDPVTEKLASHGHRFNSIEQDFELDPNNEIVKMASIIKKVRSEIRYNEQKLNAAKRQAEQWAQRNF